MFLPLLQLLPSTMNVGRNRNRSGSSTITTIVRAAAGHLHSCYDLEQLGWLQLALLAVMPGDGDTVRARGIPLAELLAAPQHLPCDLLALAIFDAAAAAATDAAGAAVAAPTVALVLGHQLP